MNTHSICFRGDIRKIFTRCSLLCRLMTIINHILKTLLLGICKLQFGSGLSGHAHSSRQPFDLVGFKVNERQLLQTERCIPSIWNTSNLEAVLKGKNLVPMGWEWGSKVFPLRIVLIKKWGKYIHASYFPRRCIHSFLQKYVLTDPQSLDRACTDFPLQWLRDDRWMNFCFTSLTRVFQIFQDGWRLIMQSCVNTIPFYSSMHSLFLEVNNSNLPVLEQEIH